MNPITLLIFACIALGLYQPSASPRIDSIMAKAWRPFRPGTESANTGEIEFDTEMPFAVYSIRGGPEPEKVPKHFWCRWELWDYQYSDGGPKHVWKLYRRPGAGPLRHTAETDPAGTWVPQQLDTEQRRKRRARQGNSGLTNFEYYEEPSLL